MHCKLPFCFANTNNGPFKIEDMFITCNYQDVEDFFLLTSFVSTVGSKICMTLANNSFMMDPQIVDEYVDFFIKIMKFLSK